MKQAITLNKELFEFPQEGGEVFLTDIENIDWDNANYLNYTIETHNPWIVPLIIRFHGEDGEFLQTFMATVPQTEVSVAFPLSALDAQNVFLPRKPGKLKTVIFGEKLDVNKISKISIGTCECYKSQSFTIKDLHISDKEPEYILPDKKIVDKFGQWNEKDWPNKVESEESLVAYLQEETKMESNYPDDWSKYGGWKGKSFSATGFFQTAHDGKRWWLVDPDGNAFWSAGLDCVNPGVTTLLDGIEKFYEWIPQKDGEYKDIHSSNEKGQNFVDYATANLIRAYKTDYFQQWTKMTVERMKKWRFNTVGNWSSPEFIKQAKIPYVWPMKGFPGTAKTIFRDFPDAFSKEYESNAKAFAQQLEPLKDDPYMIGYFLTNEPLWAFADEVNLAEELMEKEEMLESKNVLIEQMKEKYNGKIELLNEAWNQSFQDFNDLLQPMLKASKWSNNAKEDLESFTKVLVYQYIKVVCEAVKEVDSNHLNFGMRYAWISSDNIYEGSKYFDVFTLNMYQMVPDKEKIMEVSHKSGLPVLIGEFHFGAPDVGLPSTGLRGVATQADRGIAYRNYVENGVDIPALVGTHYFTLVDQGVLGRFDGENFQIGVVDICHQPYEDFVQEIITTHENLYDVASGKKKPFFNKVAEIPRIGF